MTYRTQKFVMLAFAIAIALTYHHHGGALSALPVALMAFPSDSIDVVDLRALADGGFVREDLYRKVFFLQTVADTPFTNLTPTGECNSDKTEWTFDNIRSPDNTNAAVAGSDPSSYRTATGTRVSQRAQICRGAVSVTSTARKTAMAGNYDQLMYETDKELKGIRQDVEAIILTPQATVVGDNNTTAQKMGGFPSWLTTNTSVGAGSGADGGYNTSTHVVDAPTAGTIRPLSWATVTTMLLGVYNSYGNCRYLMSTPEVVQKLNAAIVAGTIKVATPTATLSAGSPPPAQTGQQWFTGVISDFGFMITFVPNRTQQLYNSSTAADVFLIDPEQVAVAYHEGYEVLDLGRTSVLRWDRDIAVSAEVQPYREDAHAVIRDIDPTAAVTA